MAVPSFSIQSQCHFLALPSEIRNTIYEIALTEDEPLLCTAGDATRSPKLLKNDRLGPKNARCEANQLKYACWQLRYETKVLSLQFNEIHFIGIENFESFLVTSRPDLQKRFRNIVILDDHDSLKRSYTIDQLVDRSMSPILYTFCSRNPRARVLIRNTRLFTEGAWLNIYCKLRETLRNDMGERLLAIFDPETAVIIQEGAASLRCALLSRYKRTFLENLRIVPTVDYPQLSTYWTNDQLLEAKRLFLEGC